MLEDGLPRRLADHVEAEQPRQRQAVEERRLRQQQAAERTFWARSSNSEQCQFQIPEI